MKFGSLFAGIGGIDLGLERAGMECVWQVEIDPYCQKVLAKHWPEVEHYSDIKECGADNLDPVDLICGGFPCQDISYAGKGAGIEGKRSRLWKEFYRIICELRPRYVLVENVPALLRRGIDVVLGDLASCGYDAEWESLPAAAFGAPHRRDRVFVVAYRAQFGCRARGTGRSTPSCARESEQSLSDVSNSENMATESSGGTKDVANTQSEQRSKPQTGNRRQVFTGRRPQTGWGKRWPVEPDVGRVANGVSAKLDGGIDEIGNNWLQEPNIPGVASGVKERVNRLRCLGNAVVPQVAEWIGKKIMETTA